MSRRAPRLAEPSEADLPAPAARTRGVQTKVKRSIPSKQPKCKQSHHFATSVVLQVCPRPSEGGSPRAPEASSKQGIAVEPRYDHPANIGSLNRPRAFGERESGQSSRNVASWRAARR